MTTHKKIIIRDNSYWAADESLMTCIARFKRLSGKYPSAKADITMFEGTFEEIENIGVDNDLGDIRYAKNLKIVRIQ